MLSVTGTRRQPRRPLLCRTGPRTGIIFRVTASFTFLADAFDVSSARELGERARAAEDRGVTTFVLPDHLVAQPAPVPYLAAVAALTERIRISAFVHNNDLRHPAVLAQELATLDALAGEAEKVVDAMRERSGIGLTVQEVIDSPHVFIGSYDRFVEKFNELRDRLGISSFLIGDLDQLGPVVERLAGS